MSVECSDGLILITKALAGPRARPPRLEVDKGGCITVLGRKLNKEGYLRIGRLIDGKKRDDYAHRIVFEAAHGPGKLLFGQRVHHLCGNKACLNPDHLEKVSRVAHRRIVEAGDSKIVEGVAWAFWSRQPCDAATLMKVFGFSRAKAYKLISEWKRRKAG